MTSGAPPPDERQAAATPAPSAAAAARDPPAAPAVRSTTIDPQCRKRCRQLWRAAEDQIHALNEEINAHCSQLLGASVTALVFIDPRSEDVQASLNTAQQRSGAGRSNYLPASTANATLLAAAGRTAATMELPTAPPSRQAEAGPSAQPQAAPVLPSAAQPTPTGNDAATAAAPQPPVDPARRAICDKAEAAAKVCFDNMWAAIRAAREAYDRAQQAAVLMCKEQCIAIRREMEAAHAALEQQQREQQQQQQQAQQAQQAEWQQVPVPSPEVAAAMTVDETPGAEREAAVTVEHAGPPPEREGAQQPEANGSAPADEGVHGVEASPGLGGSEDPNVGDVDASADGRDQSDDLEGVGWHDDEYGAAASGLRSSCSTLSTPIPHSDGPQGGGCGGRGADDDQGQEASSAPTAHQEPQPELSKDTQQAHAPPPLQGCSGPTKRRRTEEAENLEELSTDFESAEPGPMRRRVNAFVATPGAPNASPTRLRRTLLAAAPAVALPPLAQFAMSVAPALDASTPLATLRVFLAQAGAAEEAARCVERAELLALAVRKQGAWEVRRVLAAESSLAPLARAHAAALRTNGLASKEVLSQAYKELRVKIHPDKNPGDPLATRAFQFATAAHRALCSDRPLVGVAAGGADGTARSAPFPFYELDADGPPVFPAPAGLARAMSGGTGLFRAACQRHGL